MMVYKLIRATSVEELESAVNKALNDGWELMGTPVVVATPTAVVWYLREMYQVSSSTNEGDAFLAEQLDNYMEMFRSAKVN